MRTIQKVLVVGGGAMGGGIARVLARAHLTVVVKERTEALAEMVRQKLYDQIDQVAAKGVISEDEGELQKSLIYVIFEYGDLRDIDFVIEAIFEDLEVKRDLFRTLDLLVAYDVIFASNTSSLSISDLASSTNRPSQVIGVHFFNPPTKLPLVEIILGRETSEDTFENVFAFVQDVLGKTPIRVKEVRGFLVNRILLPYLNEAALALEEVDIDPRLIDAEARKFGWPMGPFLLLDMVVGLDVARDVANVLYGSYGERMLPSQVLTYLADSELKRFGQKTGAGVYIYDVVREKEYEPIEMILGRLFPARRNDVSPEQVFERMMLGMINEAARCLEEEVATVDDIEIACVAGIVFPAEKGGILHYADSLGLASVVAKLEQLEARYGARFSPASILRAKAQEGTTFFEEW